MTNNIAIKVEGLGKRYRIGQYIGSGAQYKTLRESLTTVVSAPLRRLRRNPQSAIRNPKSSSFLWALRDVSFKVKHGEVLGIIGRNGAGKSTLLKVLTRITEPSEGRAVLSGRVNSLLEVGTGFHPELTGRENVRLSGAILGMSRKEIDRKFDEIVDFSGVEKFIDTPVKRYSSGMKVRLGFAVAAYLEPEILLVDEVLAVGDADFQRKCLGKMRDVAGEGRTVLLVSHNTGSIAELCQRTILLREGTLVEDGPSKQVVSTYLMGMQRAEGEFDLTDPSLRWSTLFDSRFKWIQAQVLNSDGRSTSQIKLREPFEVILQGLARVPIRDLEICFAVYSEMGFALFNSCQRDSELQSDYPSGHITFQVAFNPNLFGPGQYSVDIFATALNTRDYIRTAAQFSVSLVNEASDESVRANYGGVILYPCTWSVETKY